MVPLTAWRAGAEALKLQSAWMRMALSANEVILRRSAQMARGAMTPVEATRMMMEKPAAFAHSAERAAAAIARGASVTAIASAALRPYGVRTRANARRLGR